MRRLLDACRARVSRPRVMAIVLGSGIFGCSDAADPRDPGNPGNPMCSGPADENCEQPGCQGAGCMASACGNGVRDAEETDTDCGGSCAGCESGRACSGDSDCASGTCGPALTCAAFAVVSFRSVTYAAGEKPYVALAGDLDGDDRTDLVVADELGDEIYVFANGGSAGLGPAATYEIGPRAAFPIGAYPTGGAIADFNHDGALDVVTADYHGNAVSVLLNTGTGALGPSANYPTTTPAETSNLAVGDLNGDGNVDVVATNPVASSFSVLLGRANGTLAPAVNVPVGRTGSSRSAEPYAVAIADFDHDGRADVAVAASARSAIIVRRGNGDGTFQPEEPYAAGGAAPYILITADVDRDGNADLVTANRNSDDVSVLRGRADGTFEGAIVSTTGPMSGPYSVAVADFNLDGVADLVTGDFETTSTFAGNDASVLLGRGDGSFAPPIIVPGTPAYGVATGDFNADGKPDFAAANFVYKTVTVNLSTSQ